METQEKAHLELLLKKDLNIDKIVENANNLLNNFGLDELENLKQEIENYRKDYDIFGANFVNLKYSNSLKDSVALSFDYTYEYDETSIEEDEFSENHSYKAETEIGGLIYKLYVSDTESTEMFHIYYTLEISQK